MSFNFGRDKYFDTLLAFWSQHVQGCIHLLIGLELIIGVCHMETMLQELKVNP